MRLIDAVPVVYAHWIKDGQKQDHGYVWYHCSNCGNSSPAFIYDGLAFESAIEDWNARN